jgi:glycosyltransferase involved in cell wall biosynthesis
MLTTQISDPWNGSVDNQTEYTLWDIYPCADFITYPSVCEGFGNALIEAVYFKKPILVNRYATFIRDIEPKGFEMIVMDGFLTKNTVHKTKEIIESPELKEKMVNTNYEIASRHYSYSVLRNQLNTMMNDFSFQQEQQISNNGSDSQDVIYLKRGSSTDHYDRSMHNVTMDMSK